MNDSFTAEDRKCLTEIALHLKYVREEQGSIRKTLDSNQETVNKKVDSLEKEVEDLKLFRYWILGAAAMVSIVVGFASKYFTK